MKITTIILVMFCLCLGMPIPGDADMSSTNYRITTTVVSGGGGPMASTNYKMNATLGQPSPLIDTTDSPWSTDYEMLTGFWYTLGGGCAYDYDTDGDVDGADLHQFINAYDVLSVPSFADEFGGVGCQ
jgi:hypothetical protein